ncbi:MAG TPA: ECF RNA polymerase sigma factor SigK [Streptosporangiaceae bacterium]
METVSGRRSPPRHRVAGGASLAGLLARTARGDQDAFAAAYDQAAPALYGTVLAVIRDPFLAEEVTQEVFLEIWRTAARYDQDRGSALAWMATIAHRRAVDRVRSEQRAADRDRRAATHAVAYDEVAESAEHNLERERVRRCLKWLTELQREAVTLAYYRGRTYREVAALLGIPAGTVSTRMRDGLIRLRDCLGAAR